MFVFKTNISTKKRVNHYLTRKSSEAKDTPMDAILYYASEREEVRGIYPDLLRASAKESASRAGKTI